jgi:hypothetical protein
MPHWWHMRCAPSALTAEPGLHTRFCPLGTTCRATAELIMLMSIHNSCTQAWTKCSLARGERHVHPAVRELPVQQEAFRTTK